MIPGLLKFLKGIESWEEIDAINPGVIEKRRGSSGFEFKIQYRVESGLKCIACSEGAVQEVFIVTSSPERVENKLESF